MTRGYLVSLGAALALGAIGCGDNSKQCGPGTTDVDGVCTGEGGGVGTCSDGTILVGDHCEIDPNSCQDGTVLVGSECKDPGVVTPDLEEAAEPNGLGLLGETSTVSAGTVTLKPEGEHFVIHGTIVPFQDTDGDGQNDADIDTYLVDVTTPVMLNVSADGMHGLAGGFVAIANVAGGSTLASWTRFGVNPTGDTATRKLYLPAAGTYLIAIADSRSLFLTGAAPGAAEGGADLEYYVTIDQVSATPTALTPSNGVATSSGTVDPGDVKLFSIEMGEGINDVELSGVNVEQVQESLLVTNTRSGTTTVKALADGDPGAGATAAAEFLGIHSGDSQIVVVDSVFDYANNPYDYDLTVTVRGAAALATDGGDAMQPSSDTEVSLFYYDVAPGQQLIGMDLAFDRPVAGVLVDEDLFVFSNFTYSGGYKGTFDGYRGLLNHPRPGRYYFFVFDPLSDPADLVATSTYAAVTPATITKGTALTSQAPNAYESTPFSYSPGTATDPWQQFTASGSGTGTITASYYDPSTAFGRLDPLTSTCATCDDSPSPVFEHDFDAAGDTYGRILLDDPNQLLVTVHTATTTGSPMFDLTFEPREFTDLGTATGMDITKMDQPLDNTTPVQRYLVRSEPDSTLTMTVDPALTLNATLAQLDADEGEIDSASGALGAQVELESIQGANGWTAYEVTGGVLGTTFDLTLHTVPPPYSTSSGTTTFSDACNGGTAVDMDDLDEGRSSATIAAPAGFELFGTPVTDFYVFANGFLSFDTNLVCPGADSCFFSNKDIPAAADPNALIAPYWDDIVLTSVCQKTSGTKLTIQWTGSLFFIGTPVTFQAILDGATGSIEFVYGPSHAASGDGATIGLENDAGTDAKKLGYNTADTANNTLFTPN